MDANQGSAERPTPRLIKRACGGWLAVSPNWARFSIGVEGDTEDEAQGRFMAAYLKWMAALDDTVQKNT